MNTAAGDTSGMAAATDPAATPPATPPAATPPAATPPAATPPADPAPVASSVRPSPGCGKAGRPANGTVMVANDHIYDFPQKYDGNTPLPVVFGFHANANPITQIEQLTKGTPLATNYVMVFPKSVGQGWVLNTDKPRLDGWYKDITENYCVDESHVFAIGHSSGTQFIVQLLCQGEDRFTALAPVASSMYCTSWKPLPTLLIHGSNDMERASTSQDANGRKDLGPYLTSNSCSMNTQAYNVAGCTSQYNGAQVNPNCMSYQGCSEPMIWCSHNDLNYSGTNHGWPCFASQAMYDFFSRL
jgi:polyhydroxybutyrate depolymerase